MERMGGPRVYLDEFRERAMRLVRLVSIVRPANIVIVTME